MSALSYDCVSVSERQGEYLSAIAAFNGTPTAYDLATRFTCRVDSARKTMARLIGLTGDRTMQALCDFARSGQWKVRKSSAYDQKCNASRRGELIDLATLTVEDAPSYALVATAPAPIASTPHIEIRVEADYFGRNEWNGSGFKASAVEIDGVNVTWLTGTPAPHPTRYAAIVALGERYRDVPAGEWRRAFLRAVQEAQECIVPGRRAADNERKMVGGPVGCDRRVRTAPYEMGDASKSGLRYGDKVMR